MGFFQLEIVVIIENSWDILTADLILCGFRYLFRYSEVSMLPTFVIVLTHLLIIVVSSHIKFTKKNTYVSTRNTKRKDTLILSVCLNYYFYYACRGIGNYFEIIEPKFELENYTFMNYLMK